jgi:hypothetical protein
LNQPLADDRIQFYLRHRDDIRAWAAIEAEVTAAVREILAGCQPVIDERLAIVDRDVTTSRRDGGRWERILVRRPAWPEAIGISLEWETAVDPFGTVLPKVGVIFLNSESAVESARVRTGELAQHASQLLAQGYRANAERVWPLLRRIDASRDWWRDPDAWSAGIVDRVVDLWTQTAPLVDRALAESGWVEAGPSLAVTPEHGPSI